MITLLRGPGTDVTAVNSGAARRQVRNALMCVATVGSGRLLLLKSTLRPGLPIPNARPASLCHPANGIGYRDRLRADRGEHRAERPPGASATSRQGGEEGPARRQVQVSRCDAACAAPRPAQPGLGGVAWRQPCKRGSPCSAAVVPSGCAAQPARRPQSSSCSGGLLGKGDALLNGGPQLRHHGLAGRTGGGRQASWLAAHAALIWRCITYLAVQHSFDGACSTYVAVHAALKTLVDK